eukprot:3680817-Amphidinium_carterae.1
MLPPHAKGNMTSTYHRWVRIRGGWHAAEGPQTGDRWSVSVFTPQSIQRLSRQNWDDLGHLGFPVQRLRRLHDTPGLRSLRVEWRLASCALAAVSKGEQPLEAGPHVDEADPWLTDPEMYQGIHDNISGRELPAEM